MNFFFFFSKLKIEEFCATKNFQVAATICIIKSKTRPKTNMNSGSSKRIDSIKLLLYYIIHIKFQ